MNIIGSKLGVMNGLLGIEDHLGGLLVGGYHATLALICNYT
jgi:hypothetical protein